MNKKISKIMIVMFLLSLISCVPEYKTYKGDDVAILSGDIPNIFESLGGRSFTRLFINGKRSDPFYLKPGKYTITMRSRSGSIFSPLSGTKKVILDLKPHKKYQIMSEPFVMKGLIIFSLFDITNKNKKLIREYRTKGFI